MTNWNTPDAPAPGWSVPDKPLAAMPDSYAEDRAQVPRNHHGQYLIPSADGRQPATLKGRPRVSTIAKVGPNTDRLQMRAERLVAEGIAKDPAVTAEAMRALALQEDTKERRDALQKVATRAFAAAGGHDRANRGTRIHQLVDDIKRGNDVEVPEELRADVDAYFAVLEKFGLEFCPEFMERVVLCPYDTGGAIDDIMRRWNPDTEMYEYVIVDTKTGATLDFSRLAILSQTWMYANALCFFVTTDIERDKDGKITAVRGHQEDMPLELRRDRAVIIHLDGLGAAHYHELDISGHGRVVAAQIEIKRADAEAKHKFRLVGSVTPDAFVKPTIPTDHTPTYDDLTTGKIPRHPLNTPATPRATGGALNAAFIVGEHGPRLVRSDGQGGYTDMIDRTFGDQATGTMRDMAAAADAAAAVRPPAVSGIDVLDGAGKPLGPFADRSKGERGCSVCGRKGHKSTSPRCLKDQDPAKAADRTARDVHASVAPVLNGDRGASPALGTEPIQPHELAEAPTSDQNPPTPRGSIASTLSPGVTRNPDGSHTFSGIPAGDPEPQNNCDHLGDGDWHPFLPGQCDPAGPSAADSADGDDAPPPPRPVQTHYLSALPYCTGPAEHPGPCGWHADPRTGDYVCATSGKPSEMVWRSRQPAPDFTLNSIAARTTVQDLLTFRQSEIAAGRWHPHHETACLDRHAALTADQ